jgi:serine/threonine protein kinase/tetratricopeptide (TPR) repeat protein
MNLPTDSQWARYSMLCRRLQPLPTPEREAVLQQLRATGDEDPQVLSLVALHCALPPDPARDRTGDHLGDFTLEEPLGAGGMGVVYRAQQHIGATTRPVAVKLIHPAWLRTAREQALAQFQAELGTLVKLEHESIARIYGGGIAEDPITHESLLYIAMELVRGGLSLTTYVRDHALAWQERLTLFLRVCRAVQYAHEHRILHRDLKPANLLVDSEGHPFVIDFGLARAYDEWVPGGVLVSGGTPAYMSPEQVADGFGALSAKTDVYALGLILYEVLTGQLPYRFPPDSSFAQLRQVITEAVPRPLREYDAAYRGELEAIVAAALAKRPADRLLLAALRSRLERYLQQLPPDITRPRHTTSPAQRDLQSLHDRGDRGIARSAVRGTEARPLTAPAIPMPGEHHNQSTTFIGRREYLDWFETCFQEAQAGRPRIVFLSGEAGVGKTRLLRELRGAALRQGLQTWAGRCYEDLTLPYLPFIDVLLPLLEQLPAEGQPALDPDVAVLRRFFRWTDSAVSLVQTPAAEEAYQDKLLVFLAVSRLLIALAQHRPLVVLFDDLHWADSPSLDLLSYVVFTVAEAALRTPVPLTIIGAFRPAAPEERLARLLARFQREEVCHTLDLLCLPEAEVHDLLQGLGLTRPSRQLVTTVTETTQGNPLFIQEVVEYLRQHDLLREVGEYLVPTVAPADLRLPEKVTIAIARRIQDLSLPCQHLLTLASCLGEHFTFDLLAAVSGEPEAPLLTLLEEGMQHTLLLSRGQTFQFVHALIRQAFYNVPSVTRRQRLHQQIAQTLEQVHAEHLEEHAMAIAHHLVRAGTVAAPGKVVAYACQAGHQACSVFAWGEAARYYEAALTAGSLSPPERAVLHHQAGSAYHRDQDIGPCIDHYTRAIEAYRTIGDVRGLAQVLMLKTELLYSLTSVPLGTLPDVQPLAEVLGALGDSDPGLRGRILNIMALAYRNARQTTTAQQLATQALDIGHQLHDDDLCARAGNTLGQIQIHQLRVKESLESYTAAVASARRIGDLWLQGLPLQRAPLGFIMLGQMDAAETAALEACELVRTTQDWGNYSLPLAHLTYVHVARGDWSMAQHYAQEALRMGARSSHPWGGARTLFALACMHTARGAWQEAEHMLDMLVEPGRVFREVGPMIRTVAEAFRRLIGAYAGSVEGGVESLGMALQQVVEADAYSLAPCCALVELSDLLATPDVAEQAAQTLAHAAEGGVLFTPEWIFLLPRVLGIAATLHHAWEKAETAFQAAITAATRAGARSELARTYVDYARMLLTRNRAGDWSQARAFLDRAEPLCQDLGLQLCLQRQPQLMTTRAVARTAFPQPAMAGPAQGSPYEVERA